ncbi:unnamed protein product [Oncorhynchus mykiss]|uniref:Immunoglobulin V-set domain-containing protein n=1 Tax=Oncorhynchus mykiss TaxID=8022 RepID=A0A060WNZ3_ONCMY|nr:unnamed protein product [Oncorhynchus mykiss]
MVILLVLTLKVVLLLGRGNSSSNGRYSLKDNREESVFIVTITNLTLNDAGRYWCGVDKWGKDNYIKVNLEVSRVLAFIALSINVNVRIDAGRRKAGTGRTFIEQRTRNRTGQRLDMRQGTGQDSVWT